MRCIVRNKSFLKKIYKSDSETRKKLINSATPDEIRSLSEIAHNVTTGNFTIPDKKITKLSKYKQAIRKLSRRTLCHKKKKQFLIQEGGFLPFLISPVLSTLGAIGGRIISSQLGF